MTLYIFFNVKWFKLKTKEGKIPVGWSAVGWIRGSGMGSFLEEEGA